MHRIYYLSCKVYELWTLLKNGAVSIKDFYNPVVETVRISVLRYWQIENDNKKRENPSRSADDDVYLFVLFELQLKISFNETSLQSTYEYPSENSVWDSGGEEEEEEEGQEETVASEQPSMVGRIHIPRPNIIASSAMHSPNSKGEFLAFELFFFFFSCWL